MNMTKTGVLDKEKQNTAYGLTDDVYSGIKPAYGGYNGEKLEDNAGEFSLQAIQAKLGGMGAPQSVEMPSEFQSADVLPSVSTRKLSFVREYEAVKSSAKLTSKQKIAVASYVAVVLALVLAITFCSLAVSGSFTSAAALEEGYSKIAGELGAVNGILAQDNYEILSERAKELGYLDSSQSAVGVYDALETRPAQNYGIGSNWFDALCDWLSGVFGG